MIRTLFAAAAIPAASWGMATGTTAPIGRAEPADANCTEMSSMESASTEIAPTHIDTAGTTFPWAIRNTVPRKIATTTA